MYDFGDIFRTVFLEEFGFVLIFNICVVYILIHYSFYKQYNI